MSQDEAPSPEAHAAKVGRYFCSQMPCGPSDCTFPCRYMQDAIATRNNRDPEAILADEPKESEAEPCSKCVEQKGAPPCEFCGPPAWEAYRDGGEMESRIREAAADRVRAALLSAPRDGMTRAYAASLAVDAALGAGGDVDHEAMESAVRDVLDGMSRSLDALRRSLTSWRSPEVMPSFMVYRDGDMFCAVNGHFRNLQESASGWGRTPVGALVELIEGRAKDASPEVILAEEPKENTSMRIKIVPVPEVEMPGPRADARLEGAKMIREALEEARIVITTYDDVERDLGGNDKEQRAVYNSAIEKIDAALLAMSK